MRRLAALMVAAAVLTVAPLPLIDGRAMACSCGDMSFEDAFARADAVFTGTLIEIRLDDGPSWSSTDPARFIFDVDVVYAGEVYEQQSIVTARDGASCGLELGIGRRAAVFATETTWFDVEPVDGEYAADLCNGTTAIDASGHELESISAARPPLAGASPVGGDGWPGSLVPWLPVALLVAGVGTAVALGIARNRRRSAEAAPSRE